MGNHKTLNLLYIGAGLDIKNMLTYVNKHISILNDNYACKDRVYICVDSLPRTPIQNDTSINYGKYKKDFTDELIKMCEESGFELREAISLDTKYVYNAMSCLKKVCYSCCGYTTPAYINPELWIFTNYKTNETIKYYLSTNIEVNQHELLLNDIRKSNVLYIHKHLPSSVLFSLYNRKPRKIVATYETCFQVNKTTKGSILKVLNYNINFFYRYILVLPDKNKIYNDFNDFKDKLHRFNKNVNNI